NPSLPSELKSLEIEISYRKHSIGLNITPGGIRLHSRPSREAPVNIGFGDRIFQLGPGQTLELAP
ncbi:MAG: glycosyl hydrolase family 65 protein, partial [Dehalococcoidia bacterium]